jgi:hypothetical protein
MSSTKVRKTHEEREQAKRERCTQWVSILAAQSVIRLGYGGNATLGSGIDICPGACDHIACKLARGIVMSCCLICLQRIGYGACIPTGHISDLGTQYAHQECFERYRGGGAHGR